jgi:hypothetical protein
LPNCSRSFRLKETNRRQLAHWVAIGTARERLLPRQDEQTDATDGTRVRDGCDTVRS